MAEGGETKFIAPVVNAFTRFATPVLFTALVSVCLYVANGWHEEGMARADRLDASQVQIKAEIQDRTERLIRMEEGIKRFGDDISEIKLDLKEIRRSIGRLPMTSDSVRKQ